MNNFQIIITVSVIQYTSGSQNITVKADKITEQSVVSMALRMRSKVGMDLEIGLVLELKIGLGCGWRWGWICG